MRRRARKSQVDIAECPLYGISPLLLAETFSMDEQQASRWKADLRRSPDRARRVQLLVERDLGAFDARWHGFRVVGDRLYTPEGFPVGAAEVRAVPFFHAQLAAERGRVRAAERRLERLSHEDEDTSPLRREVEALLVRALDLVRRR